MDETPPTASKPCNECPWRRGSLPGHLGPHSPEEWIEIAHTDVMIACHKTIESKTTFEADGSVEGASTFTHQCAGAATFRSNVHKLPRDPSVSTLPADKENIFATNEEFINHHKDRP